MSYIWVGFDREISPQLIIEVLKNKFMVSNCYEFSLENFSKLQNELNFKIIDEDTKKVFYETIKNDSEFPIIWEFTFFSHFKDDIKAGLYLAHCFSKVLKCKTITDGSGFGDDNSPYWDVVFDEGKIFLVDDLETKFSGDGDKLLKVVKELNIDFSRGSG